MGIIFWSILSIAIWFLIGIYFALRKRNPLHIGLFFSLLFIVNFPVKLLATEAGMAVIDSSLYGEEWQTFALFLSNLSALLFIIPLALWTSPPTSGTQQQELVLKKQNQNSQIKWKWIALYLILIFSSYGFDPISRLLSQTELRELIALRGERRVGSALSALSLQSAQICLIVACLNLAKCWDRTSTSFKLIFLIVSTALAYALLGVSGSKNITLQPFAFFVLAYSWVRTMRRDPIHLSRILTLGILGVVLLAVTGYLRGFADADQEYPEGRAVYAIGQVMAAFDAPDNLTVILYQMNDITWGDMDYQPTLDNLLLSMIPRAIWSDKPLLLGNQKIMSEYMHERFTDYTGEVLVPSMPGEMIVSGGIVFLIPASILLGLMYTLAYRLAHKPTSHTAAVVIYIWLTLNTFNLLRSGTGLIGPLVVCSVLTIVILWLASFFKSANSERKQYVLNN